MPPLANCPRPLQSSTIALMPLTPRQQRFVAEYLIDLNATAAARRAGYSTRTAHNQGPRLLANVEVQQAIQLSMSRREDRTQIKADNVLNELAKIAFSDLRSFVEWNATAVTLKDSAGLAPEASACVSEVSQTVSEGGGSIRFKLHDKVAALKLLGEHLGLFDNRRDPIDAILERIPDPAVRAEIRAALGLGLSEGGDRAGGQLGEIRALPAGSGRVCPGSAPGGVVGEATGDSPAAP